MYNSTSLFFPLLLRIYGHFCPCFNHSVGDQNGHIQFLLHKQEQKRPLDTPKRMIERRETEGEREKER